MCTQGDIFNEAQQENRRRPRDSSNNWVLVLGLYQESISSWDSVDSACFLGLTATNLLGWWDLELGRLRVVPTTLTNLKIGHYRAPGLRLAKERAHG